MTNEALGLTVGDTAPTLTGRCTTRDPQTGNVVAASLVGATAIKVHIRRPDKTVIVRTATATDANDGVWACELQAGDLNVPGTYYVEVEVTYSSGKVQTFALDGGKPIYFTVRDQYA